MWDFAHYKHCDVLDKFKQMLRTTSAFCMVNGKKEKAIGEYSVKNMKKGKKTLKKDKYKGRSIGVALIYLT